MIISLVYITDKVFGYVNTHPCPNYHGGLAKSIPVGLGQGQVTARYRLCGRTYGYIKFNAS